MTRKHAAILPGALSGVLLFAGCDGSAPTDPVSPPSSSSTGDRSDPLVAAIAAQEAGDNARAAELYTSVLDADPGNITAAYNRAIADIDLGNLERAAESLTALLDESPEDAEFLVARGLAQFNLGDLPGALRDFQAAIESDPLNPAAYEARADVWVELGETEAAIVDYWNATRLNPDDPTLYASRELVHAAAGRAGSAADEAALGEMTEAIIAAEDAGPAPARLRRGLAFLALGESELALADLIASHEADPSPAETGLGLAHARLLVGEDEAALEGYSSIANDADAPADVRADALAGRAALYELVGAPDLAAADLRLVIDLGDEAESADARLRLAWMLATSAMDDLRGGGEAIALATAALSGMTESDPARWLALDTLAAAHAEAGDFANARTTGEQAVAAAPAEIRPEVEARLDGYRVGRPHRARD